MDRMQAVKYLALGDSLAVGISAFWGRGYTRLYYEWLQNSIGSHDLYYSNLGVIGLTSEKMLFRLRNDYCYRTAIKEASIITIDIGGNDILGCKRSPEKLWAALRHFKSNIFSILQELRILNSHAKVYLMDLYNPYPNGHEMHDIAETWVTQFNSIIRNAELTSQYRISGVANVYAAFKGNEAAYTLIEHGNVHPNTLGHKVICDCYQLVTTF